MSQNPGRKIARPAQVADQEAGEVSRPSFAKNYPQLWDFLAKKRESEYFNKTGTFSVFWEDGVFKVFLMDRPAGTSTCVSAPELHEALQIADRGIRSGTLKWRDNKPWRARAKGVYA